MFSTRNLAFWLGHGNELFARLERCNFKMKHTFIEIATNSIFSPIVPVEIWLISFAICVNDSIKKIGSAKLKGYEMSWEQTFFKILWTWVWYCYYFIVHGKKTNWKYVELKKSNCRFIDFRDKTIQKTTVENKKLQYLKPLQSEFRTNEREKNVHNRFIDRIADISQNG